MGLLVLPKDLFFLNRGRPRRYGESLTGVGRSEEGDWAYKGVLGFCKDKF